MTKITDEIMKRKLQNMQHDIKIKRIREQHGNMAASMAGDFRGPYLGRYPVDLDCIGVICDPTEWHKVKMPEDMPHPTINPVWDFNMPESCRHMGASSDDYLFMLIKVESNNGWPAKDNEYSVIYSPNDELLTLGKVQASHYGWGGEEEEELFVPGKRVGFAKYPTPHGYDLWMLPDPCQEFMDEIEEWYDRWSEM